jgi:hypothetical protein
MLLKTKHRTDEPKQMILPWKVNARLIKRSEINQLLRKQANLLGKIIDHYVQTAKITILM